MKPIVTVVIPTHNQAQYLGEAIDSVLAQDFEEVEVSIVDNGSPDDTATVAQSYSDPRVRYYFQENSGSPVGPRNRAMHMECGEFVAFLDSDDWWLPEKLGMQVELLRSEPDVALVFSDYHFISEKGKLGRNWFSSCRPHRGDVFAALLRQNFIPNSTAMVRRVVIEEVGDLAEEFKICHDLDFFLRISSRHQVDYIDKSLARLRIHTASMTANRARLAEEIIAVNEAWRAETSGRADVGARVFKRIQGHYYLRAGLYRLVDGDKLLGRQHLRFAVGSSPLNALYLLAYLASFIPGAVAGRAIDFAVRRKGAVI